MTSLSFWWWWTKLMWLIWQPMIYGRGGTHRASLPGRWCACLCSDTECHTERHSMQKTINTLFLSSQDAKGLLPAGWVQTHTCVLPDREALHEVAAERLYQYHHTASQTVINKNKRDLIQWSNSDLSAIFFWYRLYVFGDAFKQSYIHHPIQSSRHSHSMGNAAYISSSSALHISGQSYEPVQQHPDHDKYFKGKG